MSVVCVVDAKNKLGEVPVWDVREQALYWVDIEGKLLQRLTPATGEVVGNVVGDAATTAGAVAGGGFT